MITIGPIRRAGKVVIYNPDDPSQVRQFTEAGAPQWVDLATATFSECTLDLSEIGTSDTFTVDADLPSDRIYPVQIYAPDATAFTDVVVIECLWKPEPALEGDAMALTPSERTTLSTAIWGALTSALTTVGSIGKFIVDKLTTGFVVSPIVVTTGASRMASSAGGVDDDKIVYQNTECTFEWQIRDATGAPLDLTGHAFSVVIMESDGTVVTEFNSTDEPSQFEVLASDNEAPTVLDVLRVTFTQSDTATAGRYEYRVRDVTQKAIYAAGEFGILRAPIS